MKTRSAFLTRYSGFFCLLCLGICLSIPVWARKGIDPEIKSHGFLKVQPQEAKQEPPVAVQAVTEDAKKAAAPAEAETAAAETTAAATSAIASATNTAAETTINSEPPENPQLQADLALIKSTAGMETDRAIPTLRWLVGKKDLHPDLLTESWRLLLRRYERLSRRKGRSLGRYLQGRLRGRREELKYQKMIYDSLANASKRGTPFAVSIVADRSINEVIRFRATEDLLHAKLKSGQRNIVRTALQQLLQSSAVKKAKYEELTASIVRERLRRF